MKVVQLLGKGKLKLQEVPIPEILEDEILVKVKAASICGTDVRMYQNGYRNVSEETPLILGHEFAGDIVKVGEKITAYKAGQRVAVAPNMGCGTCNLCVSGQTHLCGEYDAFGVTFDGGFAEYVRIPGKAVAQGNVTVLDSEISYQEAALAEPLSCVYNGQKLLNISPGDDTLIIGMGPIGMMHIMVAKLFGAGKIFVNDLSKERMQKAKQLFPDVILLDDNIDERLKELGHGGVDACIIAAPAASAQAQALHYMNMNGKILYFGGLPKEKEQVAVNTNLIHYRQLKIQGCTKQSVQEYRLSTKLVNDKRIPLELILSDMYSLDSFQEAFDNAAQAKGLKHVFVFE